MIDEQKLKDFTNNCSLGTGFTSKEREALFTLLYEILTELRKISNK